MAVGSASGKAILFGEHAVVYGQPAIAVPVTDVQATAIVSTGSQAGGIVIFANDIGRQIELVSAAPDEPLSLTVRNTLAHLGIDEIDLDLTIQIRSTIPVASGLGSGAAVATAIVRALAQHLAQPLDAAQVSLLVYETEKIFHGTPSGIDNTVVAYKSPVYFCRGAPIDILTVQTSFWLIVADTGLPSLTKKSVADVRTAWQQKPEHYEGVFDGVGQVVKLGREIIESGNLASLGSLLDENQRLLRQLDVSSPELEHLIDVALDAGASGAKLSGGGRGGNMIALVSAERLQSVRSALSAAGARRVIVTRVD